MLDDDPILDQLEALIERARREAYERGYADAVRKIMAAASADAGASFNAASAVDAPPRPAPAFPAARGGGAGIEADATDGAPRRGRAKRGSLEARLLEILADAAAEGATIAEIEAASAYDPEPLKIPSIRVALQRLLTTGRVAREGRRWRLAEGGPGPASAPASLTDEAFEGSDTAVETTDVTEPDLAGMEEEGGVAEEPGEAAQAEPERPAFQFGSRPG